MERIMRLPLLLSFLAAVITGAASHASGVDNQMTYLRMAVMMLIFFLLGVFIRNTVIALRNEVQIEKMEKKKREEQSQKVQKEERDVNKYVAKSNQGNNTKSQERPQDEILSLEDHEISDNTGDDDFEPLALSKAIKTKMNE